MKLGKKFLYAIVIIFIAITLTIQSTVKADSNQKIFCLSHQRYIYNKSTSQFDQKMVYGIDGISGESETKPLFQILSWDAAQTSINGINYLCMNGQVAHTWNDSNQSIDTKITYEGSKSYDLDTVAGKNKIVANYDQIMWLLDNVYLTSEDSGEINAKSGNSKDLEAFIAKAGIIFGNPYSNPNKYSYYYNGQNEQVKSSITYGREDLANGYYYMNGTEQVNVSLTPELVEAVEQAVLWYFTNGSSSSPNAYNKIYVTPNGNIAQFGNTATIWKGTSKDNLSYINQIGAETTNEGKKLQEQITILADYLIDTANAHADGYTPSSNPLSITKLKDDTTENNVIGKFNIIKDLTNTTLFELTTGIVAKAYDANDNEISGAQIVDKNGNSYELTDAELIEQGKDLYVLAPTGTKSVKVSLGIKYNRTKKILWTKGEGTNEEQPIVEIKREPKNETIKATLSPDTVFDLALRKTIIGVSTKQGATKSVINENGLSAERALTYDVNSLKTGTTATYNHRKDPVVIEEGDIVKYRLIIYNEGSRRGYASEIVDQLPAGLKAKNASGTYTSTDGTVKYDYVYDATTNKITFTNKTNNILDIYQNGETIDNEAIEIECEVTAKPSNANYTYFTNIAYISKAYDADLSKEITTNVGDDRDSEPGTYPTETLVTTSATKGGYIGYNGSTQNSVYSGTDNKTYFKGQQDDDDFEIVVMLPKEFDLKLVKYITAVNGDTSKGRTVTAIDTTDLASGRDTTAKYTLSKDPVKVKYGDFVTYTFRVYNEGDLDGYVTRLTDNIPLGLQFVQAKGDNKTITIYSYDAENGLTSKDQEVDETTYRLVDENNAYWRLDKTYTMAMPADESYIPSNWLKLDTYDGDTTPSMSINVKDYLEGTNKLLKAYDASEDTNKDGANLSYVDVTAVLRVSETASLDKIIRNEAAITGDSDAHGNDVTDRDSQPENWPGKDDHTKYQDDEDYDNVILQAYDISLRKFIAAVSKDVTLKDVEYLTTDSKVKSASNEYTRAAKLDTTKLKAGTAKTAIYKHTKDPVSVAVNNYVLYDIRVYNEADIDAYASVITDHLPTDLDYVDCKFNQDFGWEVAQDGKTVTTNYLSKEKETDTNETILKAFDRKNDDGKGSGVSYRDVQILARVNDKAESNKNITNIAEISEYEGEDGTKLEKDRDSRPNNLGEDLLKQEVRPDYEGGKDDDKTDGYVPGQEDDDDFERVVVKRFDLALRKQIVNIQNAYTKEDEKHDRFAKLDNGISNTIYSYYDVESNIPQVVANDVVTYSIRVYNEGEVDGTATWVTDRMPSGLEYLAENETNKKYGWKAYKEVEESEEDAIKIGEKYYKEVEYTSKEITLYATDYLKDATIKAYTGTGEADYKEVYMVARVKDKKEVTETEYKLRNTAEIGDDNGDDDDSTPGNDNKIKDEDDLDIEDLKLVEFDLALLKYVSTVYVTEDGKETVTQTNNVGNDETDIIPKVEVNRKKIDKTVVKFGYTIKITNEGDIAGYAKEITDYVPEGLKFYAEDNEGWTDEGNNVISTKLLENTLLQPGESAQVTVILRWINGSENLGVKINTAEISEDYNDKHVPDRDSTPDNKVPGEDDIDDAPVLLSIKTGLGENVMMYVTGSLIILVVLGGGIALIKKYVL